MEGDAAKMDGDDAFEKMEEEMMEMEEMEGGQSLIANGVSMDSNVSNAMPDKEGDGASDAYQKI